MNIKEAITDIFLEAGDDVAEESVDRVVVLFRTFAKRERLEELKNLPPYMLDTYPSVQDRIKDLQASMEEEK